MLLLCQVYLNVAENSLPLMSQCCWKFTTIDVTMLLRIHYHWCHNVAENHYHWCHDVVRIHYHWCHNVVRIHYHWCHNVAENSLTLMSQCCWEFTHIDVTMLWEFTTTDVTMLWELMHYDLVSFTHILMQTIQK